MKFITSKKGFTLIELMIVVAIIGILAAIAIPQFASLISKSQEGATKGNLGTIRSALSIYYGDTEGYYPTDALASLAVQQKYLQAIPTVNIPHTTNNPGHGSNQQVTEGTSGGYGDAGGWFYDNALSGDVNWGQVLVNCTHSDTKALLWTSY